MENKNTSVDYNQKVLEVKDLKKHFYHGVGRKKLTIPAVDGLTFDVYKREVFGLVGESGCGKTTTGRTVIKLYNPTEGTVKLNGEMIGAGYKEHLREIKRIKEEAQAEILKFDNKKYQTLEIKKAMQQDVMLLESDIKKAEQQLEQDLKVAQLPLEEYKEKLFEIKNDYELEVEKIKYNFTLASNTVKDSTLNLEQLAYDRELAGLKLGLEKKTEGLQESNALGKEIIESRLNELNAKYEKLFADLETKYESKIRDAESKIVAKDVAKGKIAELKATRKTDLAKAKEAYIKRRDAEPAPNREAVRAEVQKIKDNHNNLVAGLKSDIASRKANASADIAKLPENTTDPKDPATKEAIQKIVDKRDAEIARLKEIIASLKDVNTSKEALVHSRKMQMIFQDPISSLNPRMTVLDIVGEGLTIQGDLSQAEIKEIVQDTLEIVGLQRDFASRYPHEFSGGQRQRIGVARALIMNPDFIIADEPISALDVSIRAQVINLLSDLKEKLGLTILFIAHDLSVVRFFCDRIAVMFNGKIVELAEADELFENPMHPYTRSLLSSVPQPDPDYEKNRTRVGYNPGQHDYRIDKPSLREIAPGHSVYCNEKEYAEIVEAYNKHNNITEKGDL